VRITERRPLVTLKLALDQSGEIARGSGSAPVWVTGEVSRAHGMLLRARSDAILIGSGTLRDDDPELTCRLPGLLDRSPVRVVLSQSLEIPRKAKVFQTAAIVPVLLMTAPQSDPVRRAEIGAGGTEIVDIPIVGGMLWLPSVMEALVARGITRLLVEGGPGVWSAFANAALMDEVILYMAGAPSDAHGQDAMGRWLGRHGLGPVERRTLGSDTMWRFSRVALREGR
jgi:diaminohydroxyphosphoribosylaminopyrimidine deaminase/5-amino-6-(5-phosphoribosylamino)uracil reductase